MATKGILGTKLGMTQIFDDEGRILPVTVVKAGPCPVVQVRSADRDRYTAVQLGFGERKASSTNKPLAGHFAKAGVEPTRHLVELEIEGSFELGQALTVDQFRMGDLVDVTGTSKGKGFAGGMKRHNFKGMGAGHGVHKTHRAPGSIGAASTPARVFKGTKMAGRMGNERVTVQMLEVVGVDNERNLLLIKGAIPGSNGGLVVIRDAVKAPVRAAAAGGDQ